MPINPLSLSSYTTVSALGRGKQAALQALMQGRSGLRSCDFEDVQLNTWIGRVEGVEEAPIEGELAAFDCRNNRLAQLALQQDSFADDVAAAVSRYGANRVGIFIGTSTSGILATEHAYRGRDPETGQLPADFAYQQTHNVFSVADFTRRYLKLAGPGLAISTACSSSAKVFATAHRYVQSGLCDAAVVGGVDSLCLITLYGFNSLGLVSNRLCRPWDGDRDGLNIGEAAGFALLERAPQNAQGVGLLGYGESSDAHHMSAVHPDGAGAQSAMQQALAKAGMTAEQVDYINLHGTATPANDIAEDRAVVRQFGNQVPCSSTKGWTGHTLGAAGITEAIFAALTIENDFLPATLNTQAIDSDMSANLLLQNQEQDVNVVMSNSFGFGGNNCSLIFGSLAR